MSSTAANSSKGEEQISIGQFLDRFIFPEHPRFESTAQRGGRNMFEDMLLAMGKESNLPQKVNDLLTSIYLTPADIVQGALGNIASLQRLQQPLKEVIMREVLNGNPPTETNIRLGIDRIFKLHAHNFQWIKLDGNPIPTLDNINIPDTVHQFLKQGLECLTNFILKNRELDQKEYARGLYKIFRRMYHEIILLSTITCEESVLHRVIISYAPKLMGDASGDGLNPIMQFILGPFAPMLIQHLRGNVLLRPADVAKYVVKDKSVSAAGDPDIDLD